MARRAARFAIFVLRRLGQRSGDRSPKCKTPPQAEASAIGGQAEGEAFRARGGRPTGGPDSVGANRPRTDEHLLQLPKEAYPDCGGAATIFMGRHPNFTLGAGPPMLSVVSTEARRAERRDLFSTIGRLLWREGLSAPRFALRSRRRGRKRMNMVPILPLQESADIRHNIAQVCQAQRRASEYSRTVGSPTNASEHQRRCVARPRCQQSAVTPPGGVASPAQAYQLSA